VDRSCLCYWVCQALALGNPRKPHFALIALWQFEKDKDKEKNRKACRMDEQLIVYGGNAFTLKVLRFVILPPLKHEQVYLVSLIWLFSSNIR